MRSLSVHSKLKCQSSPHPSQVCVRVSDHPQLEAQFSASSALCISITLHLNSAYHDMANSTASGSSRPGIPKIPDIKSAINDIKGSVAQPFVLPRKPRSDEEAQRLYYHIRTLCYWLDAANTIVRIPYLDKLPFTFGVEAIIGSLLPIAGELL